MGFPDDGYDYLQHCRDLSATVGAGVHFVPATAKPELATDAKIYDARAVRRVRAAPVVRALRSRRALRNCSAALAPGCMLTAGGTILCAGGRRERGGAVAQH